MQKFFLSKTWFIFAQVPKMNKKWKHPQNMNFLRTILWTHTMQFFQPCSGNVRQGSERFPFELQNHFYESPKMKKKLRDKIAPWKLPPNTNKAVLETLPKIFSRNPKSICSESERIWRLLKKWKKTNFNLLLREPGKQFKQSFFCQNSGHIRLDPTN